jgi:hypothetical protein
MTIRAEIGTTGDFYEFNITGDPARDIATAVELEHPCNDNHCDIRMAVENGFPYSAAYLLGGATECPLLEAVCGHYEFNLYGTFDAIPDWDSWVEFFRSNTKECPACGSYCELDAYSCDNCLHEFGSE